MTRLLLAACTGLFLVNTTAAQKEKHETIYGNGKMITRDVTVSSFDALKASGVYELKLFSIYVIQVIIGHRGIGITQISAHSYYLSAVIRTVVGKMHNVFEVPEITAEPGAFNKSPFLHSFIGHGINIGSQFTRSF